MGYITVRSLFTVTFLLSFLFFAVNAAPSVSVGDSGELVAAAWFLGVPHPPGYPLYIIFAKLFALIPFGNIAFRANLLSAFFAALAASMLLHIFHIFSANSSLPYSRALISPVVGIFFLLFSHTFFSQAVVAEVYSLNAFLSAMLLWLAIRLFQKKQRAMGDIRTPLVTAFIFGLGLGNHYTLLLIFPALALLLYHATQDRANNRPMENTIYVFFFFLLGLSVFIYLPLRSAQDPFFDWGNPESIAGFMEVVFRKGYDAGAMIRGWDTFLLQLKRFDLLREFGTFGVMLGMAGILKLWKVERILLAAFMLALFLFSHFIIVVAGDFEGDFATFDPFFIPAYLIYSLLISFGLLLLFEKLEKIKKRKVAHLFLSILLLSSLLVQLTERYSYARKAEDFLAIDYSINTMKSLEQGAVYLARVDSKLFALWYVQMVEGYREDVRIIAVDFLKQGWYSEERLAHLGASFRNKSVQYGSGKILVDALIRDKIKKIPVYAGFLGEEYLPSGMHAAAEGIVSRLGQKGQGEGGNVWDYYILRGVGRKDESPGYERSSILNDYAASWFNLGIERYSGGMMEEAAAAYNESLRIRPYDPDTLNNLSVVYADMGIMLESAEEMAKKAIKLYTDKSKRLNAIDTLGWVYYKMGRYEDALNELNRCKKALKGDPFFHYHLGMTLLRLGRTEEADSELSLAGTGIERETDGTLELIREDNII